MKLSKCKSYVAYRLKQIIDVDSSSSQCRRLRVRWHLQLSRRNSTSFRTSLLSKIIDFIVIIIEDHIFCFFSLSHVQPTHLLLSAHMLPTSQSFASPLAKFTQESLMTTKTPEAFLVLCFFHKEGKKVVRRLQRWWPI